MSPLPREPDVILVGAGPIGIELAVLLKRAGIDVLHLEKGQVGQTISWFPRQMRFFSSNDRIGIAGIPLQTTDQSKATREEYLAYLRQVVTTFDLRIRTYESVRSIVSQRDGFEVATRTAAGERRYRAARVVLATGDMHGPRLLNIPGEDLPHVSHYFDEPHRYFKTRLLVVGGRNSAVEAALRCYHAGADVTVSYRRESFIPESVKYWLLPELEGRIAHGEITAHMSTAPKAITATAATLEDASGEILEAPADFVLLLTGYRADMRLLAQAGVELRGASQEPVYDPATMETNVRGLYVAGTVTAGTQSRFKVFIENCHIHAARICAAVTGDPPPDEPTQRQMPES